MTIGMLVKCVCLFLLTVSAHAFNQNNSLILQEGHEPQSLHPLNVEGYDAVGIQFYILEPLMRRSEVTNEWMPALATKWEIDKDNKTFTFWLREDAKWSDGKPFTAADVKFSYDILFSNQYRTFHMRPYYEGLSKVEIISDYKVRFHAKTTYFLNFHSAAGLPIVPMHIYKNKKLPIDGNKEIIGTGPYKLSSWAHGKYIHLERNPLWWGKKNDDYKEIYQAENVVLRFVGKPFMALEMMKKGSLDFMPLDYSLYQKVGENPNPAIKIHKVQNSAPKSVPYMGFNFKHPVLKHRYIRKALSLLLDRKSISEKIYQEQYEAASGPWYNESPFTPAEEVAKIDSFNPDLAFNLLKSKGWKDENADGILEKNGQNLEFTIIIGDDSSMSLLTMYQADAAKVGVKINIKQLDWSVINQNLKRSEFDALYTDWGPGPLEFDPKSFWHSSSGYDTGGLNFMGYKNPKLDKLIDEMLVTADQEKRTMFYHSAYKIIKHDMPALFFFYPKYQYYAASSSVGQSSPTLQYDVGMKYWWIKNTTVGVK